VHRCVAGWSRFFRSLSVSPPAGAPSEGRFLSGSHEARCSVCPVLDFPTFLRTTRSRAVSRFWCVRSRKACAPASPAVSILPPALDFPPAGVPSDSLLRSRHATARPRFSFNRGAPCFSHSYPGFCAGLVFSSVEARTAAAVSGLRAAVVRCLVSFAVFLPAS
jgi:hypothetical protein